MVLTGQGVRHFIVHGQVVEQGVFVVCQLPLVRVQEDAVKLKF